MEWRKCYLDVILVPLGFLVIFAYHVWLWYKIRRQPLMTVIGLNATGRRLWISAMVKVMPTYLLLCSSNLIYLGTAWYWT